MIVDWNALGKIGSNLVSEFQMVVPSGVTLPVGQTRLLPSTQIFLPYLFDGTYLTDEMLEELNSNLGERW
jgi:hypothetical protein